MIVIVCVDDRMGMAFNHRRQSQDRVLREKILRIAGDSGLWVSPYSAKQFTQEQLQHLRVEEEYLSMAKDGDFCFVELDSLRVVEERIEKVVLCRWNRSYPADVHMDIDLMNGDWKGEILEEFSGSSHEKITMEMWEKSV